MECSIPFERAEWWAALFSARRQDPNLRETTRSHFY